MLEVFFGSLLYWQFSPPPQVSTNTRQIRMKWVSGRPPMKIFHKIISYLRSMMKNFPQNFGNRWEKKMFNLILKYFHFSLIKRWLEGFRMKGWKLSNVRAKIPSVPQKRLTWLSASQFLSPRLEYTKIKNMWLWRNRKRNSNTHNFEWKKLIIKIDWETKARCVNEGNRERPLLTPKDRST